MAWPDAIIEAAAERCLIYLIGTQDLGLHYERVADPKLFGCSDACNLDAASSPISLASRFISDAGALTTSIYRGVGTLTVLLTAVRDRLRPLCGRGSGASGPARQAGGGEVGKTARKDCDARRGA